MDFEDKVSRAELRYVPACKPLTDVMGQTIATKEDRKLTVEILSNYIK